MNGPWIAYVSPGTCTLANSIFLSWENVGAGELRVVGVLVAREEERLAAVGDADEVALAVAVLGEDHAAVGRDRDVVGPVGVVCPGRPACRRSAA